MAKCATSGCEEDARMAIRTTRPTRPGLQSTVWYDDRAAPKTAAPYCKPCGKALSADLIETLVAGGES